MQGVIAAVPTPIGADLRPNKAPFIAHCRWALKRGCNGLNVLGTTGEANSLGVAARLEVMEWAAGDLPAGSLMVGTGTPSLAETVALTVQANDLGYRIALVLPPYHCKPASDDGLAAWYMALHDALGDRGIEIHFYNFPRMTGIEIPVGLIARLAALAPARFTGIKDSSGDLDYCRAVVAAAPALRVFPSSETALETAAADGFAGCISASVNMTAEIAGRIWATRENPPDSLTAEVARQRRLLAGPDLIAGVKHLIAVRTGDAGWKRTLPPLLPLDEIAGQALSDAMDSGTMDA